MNKNFKFQLNLFWQLLKSDLIIFKQKWFDSVIDVTVWMVCMVVTMAYIYPKMGMSQNYGSFYVYGMIISVLFWSIWDNSVEFIADLEGDKTIDYALTLPISSYLILIQKAIFYSIRVMSYAWIILPLSKILIWKQLDFIQINWFKLLFIYFGMGFFIGFFSLFIISFIKAMKNISIVTMRILFPLWFLGGSQFSWKFLHKVFPNFAYLTFLNPFLYGMEGVHAATLNPNDYISFWFCIGMLLVLTIIFSWFGIKRLKKRLDFI